MKAPYYHRLVLGALIFVSALLAASATAQLPTLSPGANIDAAEETAVHPTIGNPAAIYCRELGYDYEIEIDNGQRGICTLPDGKACDAWEFLQGKCGQSYSYCAQQGYEIITVADGNNSFSPEYAVCVSSEGVVLGSVTELSNLSEKATGCGDETPGGEMPPTFEEGDEYVPSLDAPPPTAFDWRSHLGYDWLPPVRNQGMCGSCWAFAAVGISEAAHNIANNNPNLDLDLSEQYLVAGCSSSGSCCGGYTSYALEYIRDSGVPDEACMYYVDGMGCSCDGGTCDGICTYRTGDTCSDRICSNRCGDWESRLTYITSTEDVGADPQTIKQKLVDIGPLAASMGILEAFGGDWDGDIYRCDDDSGVNHGVIIVGYSDAGGYWWVRNSWGTSWGEEGYFKLGYGECYVERYVYSAEADASDVGPLVYDSLIIDDDTSTIIGDGDGIVDCGETIELNVTLRNQGADTATGVAASLSTADSYISITDSQETFPDIAGGGTGEDIEDYDFVVDPDTPNGHIIHFDLDITASNGGPWSDTLDLPVECSCNDPGEPNDGPGQAVPISYGSVLTGRDICPAGDVDYYSFSGEAGDTIIADIDAQAIGFYLDSYMVLYDTDGETELTHNDDFDGLDSRIVYTLPTADTYYLMVRGDNDPSAGGPLYAYQISLVGLDHTVYMPVVLRNHD